MTTIWNTKRVSQETGLGSSTVRRWVNEFDIPHIKKPGNRVEYSEDTVRLIKSISGMRQEGLGVRTIRQKLQPLREEEETTGSNERQEREQETPNTLSVNEFKNALVKMENLSTSYLDKISSISQELSNSQYKLGKVETEKVYLVKDNEKLLEDNKKLQQDLESLNSLSFWQKVKLLFNSQVL